MSGLNFGESDLTPTMQVMITLCDSTRWLGTTGLTCQVAGGSGLGKLQSLRVTSAVLVGTDTDILTYDGSPFVVMFVLVS